jgi:hypothetical protein
MCGNTIKVPIAEIKGDFFGDVWMNPLTPSLILRAILAFLIPPIR